ncbi:MAG: hypothetical protein HYZ14_11455 [Bacteroidetes bacterium]|nr:hypothetical protein [Bacteroidota bacterium]
MNKYVRFFIAVAVTAVVLVLTIALALFLFDRRVPKLAAVIAVGAGLMTYRMIKPTAAEVEKNTRMSHEYHANGVIQAKGKIIDGQREGTWDFFDENGEFTESRMYKSGKQV